MAICDHEFESLQEHYELGSLGETLEMKMVCSKCGLKAREIWIFACTVEDESGETV